MRFPSPIFGTLLLTILVVACAGAAGADSAYQQSVEKWRQAYESRLKSDTGWLTVTGLFWLNDAAKRFSSDPLTDIVLPAEAVPAVAGSFDFHAGKTVVHLNPGVSLLLKGTAAAGAQLQPHSGDLVPDVLTIGDLTL